MDSAQFRASALQSIVPKLIEAKHFEFALELLAGFEVERERANELMKIASGLAKAGDTRYKQAFQEAWEAIKRIPDPEHHQLRRELSLSIAKTWEFDFALEVAKSIPHELVQCDTLHKLSMQLNELGKFEKSFQLIKTIFLGHIQAQAIKDFCIAIAKINNSKRLCD